MCCHLQRTHEIWDSFRTFSWAVRVIFLVPHFNGTLLKVCLNYKRSLSYFLKKMYVSSLHAQRKPPLVLFLSWFCFERGIPALKYVMYHDSVLSVLILCPLDAVYIIHNICQGSGFSRSTGSSLALLLSAPELSAVVPTYKAELINWHRSLSAKPAYWAQHPNGSGRVQPLHVEEAIMLKHSYGISVEVVYLPCS